MCEANQIDLHGATAGVVLDISTRANGGQIELCKKLGIADPSCYFNSGFMVIDMNAWKRDRVKDELIAVSNDLFDKLDAQDQSALNIVLENRTKILDVLWNTVQYEADATFSNGIVHLIGTVKPWHFDYQHHFKDLFFEYLDRTAYAGMRPPSPGSVGALRTLIERELPTLDMISGKMRRLLSVNSTTRQTKPGIETGAIKAAEVLRG